MEQRKEIEREFHDILRSDAFGQRWSPELETLIQADPLWSNMKYYAIERRSRKVVLDWFSRNCKGKRVLDYCCGNGDDTFIIARNGADEVIGIDLSERSIENCRDRAIAEGLEKTTSFLVMDAEALEFENDYFDIITEYGALHHLNLVKAYSEIARVLKPDGSCICTEALGHNLLINHYRKNTPHLRTEWEAEHILRKKDVELAGAYFDKVDIAGFFHLATLLGVPFRKRQGFPALLSILEIIDLIMLKLPLLKWQAWQIIFILSGSKL